MLADRAIDLERRLWSLVDRVGDQPVQAELAQRMAELAVLVSEVAKQLGSERRSREKVALRHRRRDGALVHLCAVTTRTGAERKLGKYAASAFYRRGGMVIVGPTRERLRYAGLTFNGGDVEYVCAEDHLAATSQRSTSSR